MFKRGKAAREREAIRTELKFPNQSFKRFIKHCEIVGVLGPEDATEQPEQVKELYHIFVKVRNAAGTEVTVPLADSHHLIYLAYGSPKSLIGKFCTIEYMGTSIQEASSRGLAYIERDMEARFPEERPNLSIAALAGIMSSVDHSKLGTTSDFEGSEK